MVATPRPSASVVLVRPRPGRGDGGTQGRGDGRWETYLVQRSTDSPLLANFWVFPGGTLRPDDYSEESRRLAPSFSPQNAHAALTRPPGSPASGPEESLAYFVAAARELFEEAGVLLGDVARPAQIGVTTGDEAAIAHAAQRLAVERGRAFAELGEELGMTLALDRLVYYAHWITPEAIAQRFDTRFFLAVLPDEQETSPSPYEIAQGQWIDVPTALAKSREGQLPIHFATQKHLARLAPFETLDDLLHFARTKPVVPVMPPTRDRDSRVLPYLPEDLDGTW